MFLQKIRNLCILVLFICLTMELTAAPPPSNWLHLSPSTSPSPRSNASMASDNSGNLILFGGKDSSGTALNETWSWDGTTWTQVLLPPSFTPPARFDAAMALDKNGLLILFGGTDINGNILGDTWGWNGSFWMQQNPIHQPIARTGASLAIDRNGLLILFSGNIGTNTFVDDTWGWDGSDWALQHPSTLPPARFLASMAFDSVNGQIILFGGRIFTIDLDDTWSWNGSNWTQLSPTTSPSARSAASIAFDNTIQQLVLFGGQNNITPLDDTWIWDGTNITWVQLQPTSSPSARFAAAMALDTATNQLILFGGITSEGVVLNDTWSLVFNQAPTPVGGPTHFRGEIKCKQCQGHINLINILTWKASSDPSVIGYLVFQGNKLIATIQGRNVERLKIPHRKSNKRYHYSIVAFTASGAESEPLTLSLKGSCVRHLCHSQ